jgi:hypothetical protein
VRCARLDAAPKPSYFNPIVARPLQIFRPPRNDGPGNYGRHEQNGGRLFSVSTLYAPRTIVGVWACGRD